MIKKVFKYKVLIFKVLRSLVKNYAMRVFLSDKKLLNKLADSSSEINHNVKTILPLQPKYRILRHIDMIINYLLPNTTCLIRSFVKRDVLLQYGIKTSVCFGLLKEDNIIKAHSWLSIENNSGYSKVYQAL